MFNKIKDFYYSFWFNNKEKDYNNNPSQEYLFIGGSKDGDRLFIKDNEWKILIPRPFITGLEQELYNKYILSTQNTRLVIYLSNELKEVDILDRLVNNYVSSK